MPVKLYTRDKRIEKLITEATSGQATGTLTVERPHWTDRPLIADYLVTRRGLSRKLESHAASLCATLVVLPEQVEWFSEQLAKRHAAGTTSFVVGSDYLEPNRNGE